MRGHVEDGGGLDLDAGQAANDLGCQVGQVPGQVGPVEEPARILVILWRSPRAHVVQVHRELGGVEGLAFPQVFPRGHDMEPGLQLRHLGAPSRDVRCE